MKMTSTKEEVFILVDSLEIRGTACRATWGAPGSVRGRGRRRGCGKSFYCGLYGKNV